MSENQSAADLIADTLSGDIVLQTRLCNLSAIQTANDSRNAASAALNTLTKRISELDIAETAGSAPLAGTTQAYALSNAQSMEASSVSSQMLQLGHSNQQLSTQLAQLTTLVTALASKAA